MYNFDFDKEIFFQKKRNFFSKKVGVFRSLSIEPKYGSEQIIMCVTTPAHNKTLASVSEPSMGMSTRLVLAFEKSLGECVERYASAFARPRQELVSQSYDEVANRYRMWDFDKFNFFHDTQISVQGFPYRKLLRDEKLNWVEMQGLVSGETYAVPVDLIFFRPDRNVFPAPNTSGVAAHMSYSQVVVNALFELIERDALLFSWWTKTAFPAIELVKSSDLRIQKIISCFSDILPFVSLAYIELDLKIPTVVAIFRSEQPLHPKICVSSACHVDVVVAIEKALAELTQLLHLSRLMWNEKPPAREDLNGSMKSFLDNLRYYMHFGHNGHRDVFVDLHQQIHVDVLIKRSAELLDSAEVTLSNAKKVNDIERLLTIVRQRFQDCRMDPLVLNVTTHDVESLGYHIVRVVEPQLIRFNTGHLSRNWGNPRLYNLKKNLGLSSSVVTVAELNQEPVPLA